MVTKNAKILTHTAFGLFCCLFLVLTGCKDDTTKGDTTKDNAAKVVVAKSNYTTLDKFYKEHNVKPDILKDSEYSQFNTTANEALKFFTGTPYYKYVEEVVLHLASYYPRDVPPYHILDELITALYLNGESVNGKHKDSIEIEFEIEYSVLVKYFTLYSKSFLKDYPFFSFKLYKLEEGEHYDTQYFNYLAQYDKENNTKFTKLNVVMQTFTEMLVKINTNNKFEKIIKDILKVQSDTITFDKRDNAESLVALDLDNITKLIECAEAEYKSGDDRKSCYATLSKLVIYSDTFRKSNTDLFKDLPTPEELVNIYNKSKAGNATENELKALNYSPDDSTISIITHRLDNMLNPPPNK